MDITAVIAAKHVDTVLMKNPAIKQQDTAVRDVSRISNFPYVKVIFDFLSIDKLNNN